MESKAIRVIITGATGMVGEGVLHECLRHPDVERVLVINRKPGGVSHPKLTEVLHADFFDVSAIENQLAGYNACFFCLGVSSVGMKEADYHRLTYDLTQHVARTLVRLNPDMTFCYVSGAGTDSTEQGRLMWARVKGKTENALLQLPFRAAYMFRPGFLRASEGARNVKSYYTYLAWLYPIGRALYPAGFCTLEELGRAMIHTVTKGYDKRVLEVNDIVRLAAG
ncbi:NAD-dependent epimerase/dehydratase family protein [Fibrisoma montanum]|uniref:NAD-dependent epimerase/dehydratase family protein n=1 Tax=Fibrisoma montanum TaxID=2305895 RepID=A0A418MBL2_9BACT|nr:NAD-dependent epimerase/dehydratase family protein [Fibrisoma montanum]RIV23716.1 NAD-dependent epimerase/dehydratase family protein [Fibrisoma montanum]